LLLSPRQSRGFSYAFPVQNRGAAAGAGFHLKHDSRLGELFCNNATTHLLSTVSTHDAKAKGEGSMKTIQAICFVAAAAVASGLLSAPTSFAKNLNLQNQNHVGHCLGVGNCRAGRAGTSQPTQAQGAAGGAHGGLTASGAHSPAGGSRAGGRR
jgi:hypothetical protein